ncbi:hypothetical protein [Cypionkella sp.]|uniref:hypothetical protein n=1 Tax=Cypionkella sp. TaxID=2811411 RepID=UPI0027197454|nr:hypothetical protein [Cypionkella sp.]MDO8982747.1 hypothetical protein [Cypionkella sp.]MDP2051457.1 hypothetical protein [Cypionkella sp.]
MADGVLHLSTGNDPDMGQVARILRTAAAVHSTADPIIVHISLPLARRLAHHLDGGGFIDAREDVARMLKMQRGAWVEKCQGMLATARRNNRRALGFFGAALLMWLLLPVLLLIWL